MPNTPTANQWFIVDMLHAGVSSKGAISIAPHKGYEEWAKRQGNDETGHSIRLSSDEGRRIVSLLSQLNRMDEKLSLETKVPNGHKLRYHVNCPRVSAIIEEKIRTQRGFSVHAELWVTLASGASTLMKIEIRWVNQGANCWLNIQGNPTSLLAGTNAFAVATGMNAARERLFYLKLPFLLLRRILRAIDPAFAWSEATTTRIKDGNFSLHNLQLAFYCPFADDAELRRFLRWLRAVYCTPVVDENGHSFMLGEFIGLRVDAKTDKYGHPTGVMFRAYRNAARNSDLTVNFYDKQAALGDVERAQLTRSHRDWLAKHLRVDATLHAPAIDRLFTAANLSGQPHTAANWCCALADFPGGEAGFRDWLLHEALATKLKLPAVAGFRPGLLEAAHKKLSGRPRLMAVWDDWLAGRGELRELLKAQLANSAAEAAELRAVRQAGLDPDLPPPLLHRLAMISSLWGFAADEARQYSAALATGDWRALGQLLRRNRVFVARSQQEFAQMIEAAFSPAPVPIISLERPRVSQIEAADDEAQPLHR